MGAPYGADQAMNRSVSASAPHDIHKEEAVKALQDMLWDALTAGDPREYTPDQIDELPEGSCFVFGSNAQGIHAGGAARTAVEKFGAVMGVGEGLQGQSYALPTMGSGMELAHAAARFIQYAQQHPDMRFYLTKVGCGIARRTPADVAPFFAGAPANVIMPREFATILEGDTK